MDGVLVKNDLKSRLTEEFPNFAQNSPENISQLRNDAFSRFLQNGFPTIKHEDWKYTSLGFLHKTDFEPGLSRPVIKMNEEEIHSYIPDIGEYHLVVFVNGFLAPEFSGPEISLEGILFNPIITALDADPILLNYVVKALDRKKDNAFACLNTALFTDGAFLDISERNIISKPIIILNINHTYNASVFSQVKNIIRTGNNSSLKVIEINITVGDNPSFFNNVTDFILGENSEVELYKLQDNPEKTFIISEVSVLQESYSRLKSFAITLNGQFTRNILGVHIDGIGAEADLSGFYYTGGNSLADNHTTVVHAMPHSNSNQLYKGIMDDKSEAVFSGRIIVQRDAQGTNAYQSNRNILLSDDARINTKPQLEIYADDVKCSHGATSGQLDEDALFYLKARGLDSEKARNLLLNAFSSEVTDKINIIGLKEYISEKIGQRLTTSR